MRCWGPLLFPLNVSISRGCGAAALHFLAGLEKLQLCQARGFGFRSSQLDARATLMLMKEAPNNVLMELKCDNTMIQ